MHPQISAGAHELGVTEDVFLANFLLWEDQQSKEHGAKFDGGIVMQADKSTLLEQLQALTPPGPRTSNSPEDAAYIVEKPQRQPCGIPLRNLQRMQLTELCVGVQNKGKYILVQRFGPLALGYTAFFAGGKDEHGAEVLVKIDTYNFPQQDALRPLSIFAIKEPCFVVRLESRAFAAAQEDHGYILVEHLSDLVLLSPTDPLIPAPLRNEPLDTNAHALKCKEDGNLALKKGDLSCALNCYTEGISVSEDVPLTRDITRNRALVQLKLCRFDAAIRDALASLSHGEDKDSRDRDGKAYYRAGLSAYQLGSFEAARKYFEAHLRLVPDDKNGLHELVRTKARISEQSGKYDFDRLTATLSSSQPRVDAGSFIEQVEVRESGPGHGRGLFAKHHIPAGGLIICEKAVCVVYANDPHAHRTLKTMLHRAKSETTSVGAAYRELAKKLFDNPSLISKVFELYTGEHVSEAVGPKDVLVDDMPVLDSFTVHEIFHLNTFECPIVSDKKTESYPFSRVSEDKTDGGIGLWCVAAFANHSCVANADRYFIGDMMVMRATKAIDAGNEITFNYVTPTGEQDNAYELQRSWSFKCTCPRCEAESLDSSGNIQKRAFYMAKFKSIDERAAMLMETKQADGMPTQEVEKLIRKMERTYEDWEPNSIPRLALQPLHYYLFKAHALVEDYDSAANDMIARLRCGGLGVKIGTDAVAIDRTFSIPTRDYVPTLVNISTCKKILGEDLIAAEFDKLAKEFYLMHNGTMLGFDKI